MLARIALALAALSCVSCTGTTGGDLFAFDAVAGGPKGALAAQPFETGRGYVVTLTRARLHVGAVYLNRAMPSSGAQETSCVLPGTYLAQVTSGVDVDLLAPTLVPFPAQGEAVEGKALAGEVWLTGGDVESPTDTTTILEVAGTASKEGNDRVFEAAVTIGENRAIPPSDPAYPGANPICKQRIVSPIPLDLPVRAEGRLVLRIDPRALFDNVDFAALAEPEEPAGVHRFRDDDGDQPSRNLYAALRARQGVYAFAWE